MGTLQRMLWREIAVPLLLSLVLVGQLLIAMQLLQLNEVLFGAGFDLLALVRIIVYLTPQFAVIGIPLAFLLAIVMAIGRMAEDRELIALASVGRSPRALYAAPVWLALMLGVVNLGLAIRGEPWGTRGIRAQLNEMIKRNVAGAIRPEEFTEDLPPLALYVDRVEGQRWSGVLMYDSVGDGSPLLLLASGAKVVGDGSDALLRIDLLDGELHRQGAADAYTRATFEGASVAVGMSGLLRARNKFNRPANELLMSEMPAAAAEHVRRGDQWSARRVWCAFHRRLAAGWTPLVFALIAVPLAAVGRGGRGRGMGITVSAFALYYVVQTLASGQAESGRIPPWLAEWSPNLVGVLIATWLGLRLSRRIAEGAS